MSISELINELVKLLAYYGDLEICIEAIDEHYGKISALTRDGEFKEGDTSIRWINFGKILIQTKEKLQWDYQILIDIKKERNEK